MFNFLKKFNRKHEQPKVESPSAFDTFLELQKMQEQTAELEPVKLTEQQQNEILKTYNAPRMSSNGKQFAMDSMYATANKCGLITDFGRKDDRIFTYYAKHGFIGWQLCAIIAQHWLVNTACSVPAEDAVRAGWSDVVHTNEQENEELGAELNDLTNRKYKLREKGKQFIKNSKVFGVAYALMSIEGIDYSKPFDIEQVQPKAFKGISIIDPYWIMPSWSSETLNNPANPNFYEPQYYNVQGLGNVHYSHIIKIVNEEVADILKPSYYFGGVPLTQQIYERVYASERVANEAPLLALTKRLLVVPTNLKALAMNPQQGMQLANALTQTRDNQGVYFTEEGEKSGVNQLDTSLGDFDQLILTQYNLVASIAKMPAHKLLKSDPKGLNNNGEYTIKDYAQELKALQENKLRPLIERVNALALKSDFSEYGTLDFETTFTPIDMPTEQEKAQTEQMEAQTASQYVMAGILSAEEVRNVLRADKDGKYKGIAEELPSEELPEDLEMPIEGKFSDIELEKEKSENA